MDNDTTNMHRRGRHIRHARPIRRAGVTGLAALAALAISPTLTPAAVTAAGNPVDIDVEVPDEILLEVNPCTGSETEIQLTDQRLLTHAVVDGAGSLHLRIQRRGNWATDGGTGRFVENRTVLDEAPGSLTDFRASTTVHFVGLIDGHRVLSQVTGQVHVHDDEATLEHYRASGRCLG